MDKTPRRAAPSRRALIAMAAALPGLAQAKGVRPGDAIDSFIRGRMTAKGVPGAGVAVIRDGRVRKLAAYGKASLEFDVPARTSTVFPLASASKMVTGFVAGRLAEAGKLDLDGSVRDYLPELPASIFGEVRIRQMLSHTSGLGSLEDAPGFAAENADRQMREAYVGDLKLDLFTEQEVLGWAAKVPAIEPPGAKWRYNQLPYQLFGQVVKRVTGQPFDRYARQSVLQPLGLGDAVYGDHRTVVPGRTSTNYTRQFGPLQNYALNYNPIDWPAAGLNASAADMARFLRGFEPGHLLKDATLQRLWAPTPLSSGRTVEYGMGFDLEGKGDLHSAGHEGGGCVYVRWWPKSQLGLAILLNLSGSHEDGIDERLGAMLLANKA